MSSDEPSPTDGSWYQRSVGCVIGRLRPAVKRSWPPQGSTARNRGYSLLEVQIGFAVLGIATAGLTPMVIMQLRQVRQLEMRLEAQLSRSNTSDGQPETMFNGQTYYIVPWTNPWAQKVAGSAQIITTSSNPCDPGLLPVGSTTTTTYPVNIIELDAQPGGQTITAYVDVFAP